MVGSLRRVMMTSPTPMRCPRAAVTVGAVGSIGVVVDAAVERIGDLGGVAHQQGILARRDVGAVGCQRVGGHGDRIAGVQPVVAAIPVHGAAHRGRAAVA